MDKALYVAMTGAKHNMLAQAVHSNNLANINTGGFKADFAQARSMGVYYGEGYATRAYALAEVPATDFSPGKMINTGRELDISVDGEGFIAVQAPDGQEAYTRAGSFYVDSVGMLRTGNGLPVMGNGGPVAIPESDKIDIAIDGTISIIPLGQAKDGIVQIDRIKLVNPPVESLVKSEDGLIRQRVAVGDIPADAGVRVASGALESSNVNAVNELTSILELARQYEMQVKIMQNAKENSESSARLLQST